MTKRRIALAITGSMLLGTCVSGAIAEDLGMKNTGEALGGLALLAFLALVVVAIGWVDP